MKIRVLTLLLIATLMFAGAPKPAHASVGVSVGFFYNELSPYGRWVNCSYGYAWVPSVAVGWQPYSDGEWIWTEYGWTWVSDDPWPDDPFHYGSWFLDAEWGWAWAPGFVWSPAWVTWCYGDGFVGWAPLPPTFAFAAYGYSGSPFVAARSSYVFVPGNRFVGTNVAGVRMPVSSNSTFLGRGRSVTSFGVSGGVVTNTAVPVARVQAAMGRPVPVRSLSVARTDPRPVPRTSGGRLTLAAPPSVVRTELSGKPIASGTRTAPATRVRGGARTVITNGNGGPVRLTTSPKETFDRGFRSTASRMPATTTRTVESPRRNSVRSAPTPAVHPRITSQRRAAVTTTEPRSTRVVRPVTQPSYRQPPRVETVRTQQHPPARLSAPAAPPRIAGPPAGRRQPTPPPRNQGSG